MAVVQCTIEADFNKDGSYETNLTTYVNAIGGGLSIQRGMNPDGSYRVSDLNLGLDNSSGIFTPENSASSLYGLLEPKVPIRVTALHNAISYTLWTGYIVSYRVHGFGVGARCEVQAQDLAGFLFDYAPINVTNASRTTSAAIAAIAAAAGLTAGDYTLDTGQQTLPVHYVRNQDALSAMADANVSEMGGYLWITADGKIRFEARNSRLGITVDDTWGDGTTIRGLVDYEISEGSLITSAQVQANIFANGQGEQELFRFTRNKDNNPADSLALTPGQFYTFDADYVTPTTSLTAPVSTTDYLANTANDGSGTDRTSSLGVTVTDRGAGFEGRLVNNHASDTIYVTMFKLRGQVDLFVGDRPRFEYTKAIPGNKANKGIQIVLPYADDAQTTRDYAPALVHTYRWPYPRIQLIATWDDDDTKVAMLNVDLGDLIKFADKNPTGGNAQWVSGVDDWWYVEAVSHDLRPNQPYATTVTLIPSYIYRNLDRIVYDTFNRTNAVGDLGKALSGDTWADDGNMDIATNAARANSDTLQMPNLDLGASATNQVIEVDCAAIGAGDEVGVIFRHVDANNQYRLYLDKGSNELILEKNVAAAMTEITSPAFTVGTTHNLRVIMQGSRIRVWVDRILRIDTTDTGLTTGTKVGLFARNANGTTTFEDFYGQGL